MSQKSQTIPALTPRLALVADFVRSGRRVADIGTDHAYLPAFLVLSGKCPGAVACDVKPGPLLHAGTTVEKYHLADKIALRLSDGLEAVRPREAQDIVIAGMGGELILEIIRRCDWLKEENIHLVLQPMTAQPELRRGLWENGFSIGREEVAREGEKLYAVLLARYTGRRMRPGALSCYAGLLPRNGDALSRAYLLRQAEILTRAARGMEKSERKREDAPAVKNLADGLRKLAQGRNFK